MRKFALSVLALFVCVGLTLAAQVTLVKYDAEKKELKVKEGETEKTYKITDKTTFKAGDKDLDSEKAMKQLSNSKAEGKMKFDITVDKDNVTEIKFAERKKKPE